MKRLFCQSCFLFAACSSPAGRGAGTTPAHAVESQAPSASDGLLREGLFSLGQELLSEGYHAASEPELGFVAPATRVIQALTIEPRRCVAIAAVATPSVPDLDAALYAPDGSVLSEDDGPSARPVLRTCSGDLPISAYLVLFPFQGTGGYAAQRFERPITTLDAEGAVQETAVMSPAFQQLLTLLHRQGYRDEAASVEVPLVPGAGLRFAAKMLAGHCYTMLADGPHMQLRLLDARGRELSVGVGDEAPAVLQYCAREDADLTLELSTRGRTRSTRVARLFAPQLEVGGARAVWLGEPSPAWTSTLPDADAPERAGACEGPVVELVRRAPLVQGEALERSLKASSACVVVDAELHQGLSRVTLRVESVDGEVLAEREVAQVPGSLRICPAKTGQRVSVLARAGFGALTLKQKSCR